MKLQVLLFFCAILMLDWNQVAQKLLLQPKNSVWHFQWHNWGFNHQHSSQQIVRDKKLKYHQSRLGTCMGSRPIHGSCTISALIIETLQEYLCLESIPASAEQPEMCSWRLPFDSHLCSHQLLPRFSALDPAPLPKVPAKPCNRIVWKWTTQSQLARSTRCDTLRRLLKSYPKNVNNSDNWLKGASQEKPEHTGSPEGAVCGQAGGERLLTLPGEHGQGLPHSLLNVAKEEFVPGRTMRACRQQCYAFHRLGNPGHKSRELTTQLWQGWALEDLSRAQ